MKKTPTVLTLSLLIILATYWSFRASFHLNIRKGKTVAETQFSTDRALAHVKEMSKEPHGVGFPAHTTVRN